MAEQIGAEQLAGMSPEEIESARRAGQLNDYMNAPTSHARTYTAPADPESGGVVVQLSAAEVEALSPEGKVRALERGELAAFMAGDNNPAKPAPAVPVRSAFQFGEAHVALMSAEDVVQFRAEGKLVDYDAVHPAEPVSESAGGAEL